MSTSLLRNVELPELYDATIRGKPGYERPSVSKRTSLHVLRRGILVVQMLCTDPSACLLSRLCFWDGPFATLSCLNLIDLGDTDNPIPLPNVTSNVLKKVRIGAQLPQS